MTWLMMFAAVVVVLAVNTVVMIVRDGRGPQRPPRSHFDDPRFRSPAAPC